MHLSGCVPKSFTCLTNFFSAIVLAILVLLAAGIAQAQTTAPQFVYVAGAQSQEISGFQLNPSTGALTPLAGSPFSSRLHPSALAVNPAGTFLFAANAMDNDVSVFQINTTTGALTEITNSPFSTGNGTTPTALTTDPSGKFLYVANNNGSDFTAFGEIDAYAINPSTGQLTPTPNSGIPGGGFMAPIAPVGIYVHPNDHWLYVQGGQGTGPNGPYTLNDQIQGYTIQSTGDLDSNIPIYNGTEGSWGFAGSPNGNLLVNGWGGGCAYISGVGISQVDGSLSGGGGWTAVGYSNGPCNSYMIHATVDYTGTYLYSNTGSFDAIGIVPIDVTLPPTQPQGPWFADPIGPFVFAVGAGELHSYSIAPATGIITDVTGSPFAVNDQDAMVVTGFPAQAVPAPIAAFNPGGLSFSNSVPGVASARQTTQLVNPGTATLNISTIAVTGANSVDFMVTNNCPSTLAPLATCTFTVVFTPSSTAAESAAISITDNAAGSPQTLTMTSVGVVATPPSVTLNPPSLMFSQTNIGSTASLPITVTNMGTETLTVSGVTIGGPNPGDFTASNGCTSVLGGALCTIAVVFQPQAAGQRTATLTISDNVPGATQNVALSGSASAPFTVAPTGSGSATVPPNQPANYMLSFAPSAGFSGTVNFTCAVVPAGPTCSVSPPSVQVAASNNPASTPVSVIATAPASAAVSKHSDFSFRYGPAGRGRSGSSGLGLAALPWPVAFLSFAMLAWLAMPKFSNSSGLAGRVQLRRALAAVVIGSCCAIAACGGGSSGGGGTNPNPQTYTVKVTATAGTASQTVNLSLTVQ